MTESPVLRALLPRETGLWVWIGAPLFAAALLAPTLATAAGIAAILTLFAAANAARARAGRTALLVGAAGLLLAGAAAVAAPSPWHWLAALGAVLVLTAWAATIVAAGRRNVARPPLAGRTAYEVGAILGAAALGGALAAASASPGDSLRVQLVLVTWELLGLWWVRGQLARVLPREPLPRRTALLGAGASWALLTVAAVPAAAPLAAIPALYGARVALTRPVTSTRDARRIGLGEAVWTTLAVTLTVLTLHVAR